MKNLLFFTLLAITFSCQNDPITPNHGNGHLSFSLETNQREGNGRQTLNQTPSAVLLTIEDAEGNAVVQNKKLSIWSMGAGYLSESLELAVGSYKLTAFFVLSSTDSIIYASPLAGSELAQYVTNPLPLSFNITKDNYTQVTPQVLSVLSTDNPLSFGYANFGFEIINIPSHTSRLMEIWQEEPNNIKYKTYLSYSGDRLAKQTTYYYYLNVWQLLDSVTFHYNNSGKVREKNLYYVFDLQPGQQPTKAASLYEYYDDGNLKKMITLGMSGSNDHQFDFYYDSTGKITHADQRFYPSLSMRHQIKYEVNANGDVTNVKRYNALGTTLMFEFNYTYDSSLVTLPFDYEIDPNRVMQKHNLKNQETIGYNLTPDGLIESYLCAFSINYESSNNLVSNATILNPEGCTEANSDQTTFTYIYE